MLNERQRERDAEGTRPWRWKMKKAKCTSVSVRSFHFKTQGDLMLLYRELSSCYRQLSVVIEQFFLSLNTRFVVFVWTNRIIVRQATVATCVHRLLTNVIQVSGSPMMPN